MPGRLGGDPSFLQNLSVALPVYRVYEWSLLKSSCSVNPFSFHIILSVSDQGHLLLPEGVVCEVRGLPDGPRL